MARAYPTVEQQRERDKLDREALQAATVERLESLGLNVEQHLASRISWLRSKSRLSFGDWLASS